MTHYNEDPDVKTQMYTSSKTYAQGLVVGLQHSQRHVDPDIAFVPSNKHRGLLVWFLFFNPLQPSRLSSILLCTVHAQCLQGKLST